MSRRSQRIVLPVADGTTENVAGEWFQGPEEWRSDALNGSDLFAMAGPAALRGLYRQPLRSQAGQSGNSGSGDSQADLNGDARLFRSPPSAQSFQPAGVGGPRNGVARADRNSLPRMRLGLLSRHGLLQPLQPLAVGDLAARPGGIRRQGALEAVPTRGLDPGPHGSEQPGLFVTEDNLPFTYPLRSPGWLNHDQGQPHHEDPPSRHLNLLFPSPF